MTSSIETFRVVLQNPVMPPSAAELEQALLGQLTQCERLIRWAIVAVEQSLLTVEGCYLKGTPL